MKHFFVSVSAILVMAVVMPHMSLPVTRWDDAVVTGDPNLAIGIEAVSAMDPVSNGPRNFLVASLLRSFYDQEPRT